MMNINDFSDGYFTIEHLSVNTDLSNFRCKKGYGLEYYLKHNAIPDEKIKMSRTYLVRTSDTKELVAYFTLRTGLITVSRGVLKGFDTYTGIELANFAVNDMYKEANEAIPKLGSYLFNQFILPLVGEISEYVGAAYLYIFALPENKLIAHYRTMGFREGEKKASRYVYSHVKPAYDKDCIFMFQKI